MSDFWDKYDQDKNGVLNKDEFRVFLIDTFADEDETDGDPTKSQDLVMGKFDHLFQEFDRDGNGEITKEEMFDFLLNMFGVDESQIDVNQVMDYQNEKLKIQNEEDDDGQIKNLNEKDRSHLEAYVKNSPDGTDE
jgi:hypothetical protein